MTEAQIRFFQFSDALFDSDRARMSLELTPAQRRQRDDEGFESLGRLLVAATRAKVAAVISAGNLFDTQLVTGSTIVRLQQLFAGVPIPVIVAPGQLDPWSEDSMYNSKALSAKGLPVWPPNVHILGRPEHQTLILSNPSVSFTALTCASSAPVALNLTGAKPAAGEASVKVLISPMAALPSSQKTAAPLESLSLDRSESLGFTYTAFSGYPNHLIVRSEDDEITGAFAGTFIGRTEVECGKRYALECEIGISAAGKRIVIEPHEFDCRRILTCAVNVERQGYEQYLQRLRDSIRATLARENQDILVLKLFGAYDTKDPARFKLEDLEMSFFHVKVENRLRPDYLTSPLPGDSTEAGFIRLVEELRARFRQSDSGGSEDRLSEELIEDALYYGLSALREGKVLVRDAD